MPKQYQLILRADIQPLVTGGLGSYGVTSTTLVLRDEFDGAANSPVNPALWDHGEFFNANRWDAKVRAEASFLDGLGNAKVIITGANIGHGVELSSGWIESIQEFGPNTYFEWGDVILDDGVGRGHATCWTNTVNGMTDDAGGAYPTPSNGLEKDVAEFAVGIGYQTNFTSGGYAGSKHESSQGFGSGSASALHTYGALWLPSGYTIFRDGVFVRSYSAFVGTNTDQVMRFTIEHNFSAGTECYALCGGMRVWTVS